MRNDSPHIGFPLRPDESSADDPSNRPLTGSSRERLLQAAVELFAARGFDAVSVGDIEEAAGFTRRGGTLYRHFEGKREILDEAVRHHRDEIATVGQMLELRPLPDLDSELVYIARWLLEEIDQSRSLVQLIEKDSAHLGDLPGQVSQEINDPGYETAASYMARRLGETAAGFDLQATAVLLVGSIVNYRRAQWTYGESPLGVDEERLAKAWAELVQAAFAGREQHNGNGDSPEG